LDNSFGDEKVTGYEIGAKNQILDRRMLLNIAWYDYHYRGLQTAAQTVINGLPVNEITNAAAAHSYGIDLDAAYSPPAVEGLQLNAALNWNRARYDDLNNATCFPSQTIAEGCNQLLNPKTGLYTAQSLSGTPLIRAPEWQTTFGFSYQVPLHGDYKLIFTNNNTYSSRYVTALAAFRANNDQYQEAFAKVDLGVELHAPKDRWEVALIAKNIGDKVIGTCAIGNFIATNLPLTITGGSSPGAAGPGQAMCFSEAGREVWLRVTFKPFARD
jgi:outer membrane receptor protein involved in Fe transport